LARRVAASRDCGVAHALQVLCHRVVEDLGWRDVAMIVQVAVDSIVENGGGTAVIVNIEIAANDIADAYAIHDSGHN